MSYPERKQLKIAILDLYEGAANEGMRCIREIIQDWGASGHFEVSVTEFDVRLQRDIPGLEYDIFISSGGPGSPLESEGSEWENSYFNWIKKVEEWNRNENNFPKKHIFFICHSFQLAARYFNIAHVCKRKSTAFGVFPIHMLEEGRQELVFNGLRDPFYSVDSRDYQVIEPDHVRLKKMGEIGRAHV